MEKRKVELTIEKAKEWYKKGGELREVALQAFTEAELRGYPRSVVEGLQNYPYFFGDKGFYINPNSGISCAYVHDGGFHPTFDKNILPTQKLAEAMLALTQLVTWRRAWVKYWTPNWLNSISSKWCIEFLRGEFVVGEYESCGQLFSFPTEDMAAEFLNVYHDLFEQLRPLFE